MALLNFNDIGTNLLKQFGTNLIGNSVNSLFGQQNPTGINPNASTPNLNGGFLSNLGTSLGTGIGNLLSNPQNLLGGGLVGVGLAQKEDPGYLTEARQFLRNQFTSPNAISDQFSGQMNALSQNYLPLLKQQETDLTNQLSQRYANAFPASAGAQGAEFGALAKQVSDRFLPQRQALMSDLAMNLVNQQSNAAGTILNASKPDPLGEILAGLGLNLLQGQNQGGVNVNLGGLTGQQGVGQGVGVGQQNTGSNLLSQLLSPNASGVTPIAQLVGLANNGNPSALASLLGSGMFAGMPFPVGVNAATPAGQVIQQAINAGLVESPAAQVVSGSAAQGGGFLSSGLGTTLGGLGAAAGGGYAGYQIGQHLPNEATGAFAGSAGGVATGAMIGSIVPGIGTVVGAIIGGISGLVGGFFGNKSASEAQKRADRLADVNSQVGQGRSYADFWMPRLEAAGVNVNATIDSATASKIANYIGQIGGETPIYGSTEGRFSSRDQFVNYLSGKSLMDVTANLMERIPNEGDQQGQIAVILAASTLAHAQANNPSIQTLNDIPGLREQWIQTLSGVGTGESSQADMTRYVGLN